MSAAKTMKTKDKSITQPSQTTEPDPQPDATTAEPAQDSTTPPPADAPITPPLPHSTTPPSPRTRTGKIARLPLEIRDQINTRLQDGEPADDILEWLNSRPEVQSILNDHFGGNLISKGNFHKWKRGGYRDWQGHQDALDMAERLADQDTPGNNTPSSHFTEKLARWVAIQLAAATQNLDPEDPDATARLAALYQLAATISRLRRDNLSADRNEIEREWLALERQNSNFLREKEFWAWTERPEIREKLFPDEVKGLTPETLAKIEKELNLL